MRKENLENLFAPSLNLMGYDIWGVELVGGGKNLVLRVYIEKQGGISIDDCALATRQISGILDVEDPIKGKYTLEVSSPGMDRPLYKKSQFLAFIGNRVKIKLRQMYENRRNFEGVLIGIEDDEVILKPDNIDEEYCFPLETIDTARLVAEVNFSKTKKG